MVRISPEERHDVAFVVGAVVGGLAAAAVTLFQAPQSGARSRADLARALDRIGPVASSVVSSARAGLGAAARGTASTADLAGTRAADTLAAVGRIMPGSDHGAPSHVTEELPTVDELVATAPAGVRPAATTGPLSARPYGDESPPAGNRTIGSAAEAASALEAETRHGRERARFGTAIDQMIDGPRPANVSSDR